MMAGPRIYPETSFWRRLVDDGDFERRRLTYRFLRAIEGRARLLGSSLILAELGRGLSGDARTAVLRRHWAARPRIVTGVPRVHRISLELLMAGGRGIRALADMLQVGYSIVGGADFLVSWDRADLARDRTRKVVRDYGQRTGTKVPRIGTPEEVARWLGLRIR